MLKIGLTKKERGEKKVIKLSSETEILTSEIQSISISIYSFFFET